MQVGGFCLELFVALADAGDDGLDGLLAELLGATGGAGVEQLTRI